MKSKEVLNDRTTRILKGLEKSYQKLVAFKHYKKSPLIIEKNKVIIEIQPEKILPTTKYKCNDSFLMQAGF